MSQASMQQDISGKLSFSTPVCVYAIVHRSSLQWVMGRKRDPFDPLTYCPFCSQNHDPVIQIT